MIPLLLLFVVLASLGFAVMQMRRTARSRRPWPYRATTAITWSAAGWTLLVGLALLLAPLATTVSTTAGSDSSGGSSPSRVETTRSTGTLVENEGSSILVVLMVPVVVALVAAVPHRRSARQRRLGAGAVLMGACLAAILSLGFFYLPAAIALITAGAKTDRCPVPTSGSPT